jgi:uroporphyrinogen III methyltransferase/synthase
MTKQTLNGKKVLVTRAKAQSKSLIESIEKAGGEAIVLPLIELVPLEDQTEIEKAFKNLEEYNWLVFTSANAVEFFFEVAEKYGVKFYFYPELKIATVGEKTKLKLEQLGYRTNFVPIQYTAEVLAENMDQDIKGKKILIPRSQKASDEYLEVFRKRGAIPHPLTIYKNQFVKYEESEVQTVFQETIDYITFTSGSTVEALDLLKQKHQFQLSKEQYVCIGPSTAKKAETLGYRVSAIAEPFTVEGIVEAIKKLENHVQTS